MILKGFLALVVCLAVAGVTVADEGMGHSTPKSVTAVCAANSADVSWAAVTDPGLAGYNVYEKSAGEPEYAKANLGLVSTLEFTVGQLTSSVTYYFSVTAVYGGGVESEKSQPATCTTG
jgi:fibronectin type 3 domain-containing protein